VVNQVSGVWGAMEEVPGFGTLTASGYGSPTSVSCAVAGDCSAGGFYVTGGSDNGGAWVMTETKGTWGDAEEVPGTSSAAASTASVSCDSAVNCVAGGSTGSMAAHTEQAFVSART
jgi:hypothetical protein